MVLVTPLSVKNVLHTKLDLSNPPAKPKKKDDSENEEMDGAGAQEGED